MRLPLVTLPFASVRAAVAAAIAAALFAAMGTATMLGLTPQVLFVSANSLRPQFTSVSVCMTTWFSAGVSSAHFEFAPQPPVQLAFIASSFMEPDASSTIRMSGGSLDEGRSIGAALHVAPLTGEAALPAGGATEVAEAGGVASAAAGAAARVALPAGREPTSAHHQGHTHCAYSHDVRWIHGGNL